MNISFSKIPLVAAAIACLAFLCPANAMTPQEREVLAGLRNVVTQLQAENTAMQADLDAQKAQVEEGQKRNDAALVSLGTAMGQIADLTASAKAAADAAARLAAERDAFKDRVDGLRETIKLKDRDHADLLAHFHAFKFWTGTALGLLCAFLVGLLIFRFAAPALNTVPGMVLAFGVPVAVFGGVLAVIMIL